MAAKLCIYYNTFLRRFHHKAKAALTQQTLSRPEIVAGTPGPAAPKNIQLTESPITLISLGAAQTV